MRKQVLLLLFLMSTIHGVSYAAPPDAGQLLREQQPQRQLPVQLPKPEEINERPPLADSGVRVTIKEFRFTGYDGIATESELQRLLADDVGKSLGFSGLRELAAKVTAYLKRNGWFLARAYLPKQDVTSGIVEIAIIQGRSDGKLDIRPDKTVRIREQVIRDMAETAVRPGQPIKEQQLERSLLLMNDVPGVSAKTSLEPGATPGSTDIRIDVSEGPLAQFALWTDNQGNRYTGGWRGNLMATLADLSGYGDQMTLMTTGTEGLFQGRAAYSIPLTATGLKATVAYTYMQYKLIGDLASLNSKGDSNTIDASLAYPLLRTRTANISASLSYSFKALTDSANNATIRDKQLHSGTIGSNGDKYDTLGGGGYTTWNADVTTGSMNEKIADIAITDTQGAYTRFNLGLARLQRVSERITLNLSYSGQLSLDNLDSSEKFNLGGPNGIRAYPVGEASGDEGHLFNVDLRYDIPLPAHSGTLQWSGFYDAGHISLHKHPWLNSVVTADNENGYWLQGAGTGLAYAYKSGYSIRASWAHVIGDNPGRSVSGANTDGRSDQSRFWLQAMVSF